MLIKKALDVFLLQSDKIVVFSFNVELYVYQTNTKNITQYLTY